VVADELERGHAVVIASDRFAIDDAGGENALAANAACIVLRLANGLLLTD
jgi:hypothetical protein